jgi:hypothetical protein
MFETNSSRTYKDVFARAHAERAAMFRSIFTLRFSRMAELLSRKGEPTECQDQY